MAESDVLQAPPQSDSTPPPAVIRLDADDCFLQFEIYGHTFEVDAWDASDVLAKEIDAKHAGQPKGELAFLDDTVALLKSRWGVPRCSRKGAWLFYQAVTGKVDELKKTTGPTQESATGSESTADAGQAGSSAPGLPTSIDATPAEICASLT